MSAVYRWLSVERVSTLALNLAQFFGRRARERNDRHRARVPSLWGPSNLDALNFYATETDDSRGEVIAGLEVVFLSGGGSTLTISPGSVSMPNASPVTLTRPASWSGRVEADDDANMTAVLPAQTTATPAPTISGALAGSEWWLVYASTTGVTYVEQDSARKVFDNNPASPTFGQFVTAGVMYPVQQHQVQINVTRGASNGTIPTLPANAIALAYIFVPSGSTDLSNAYIFDCRRMVSREQGPNEIGGCWGNLTSGAATDSGLGGSIFNGEVHARVGCERLSLRTWSPLVLQDICEPGATWNVGGGFAYLYLCKVNGVVPRLRRKGSTGLDSMSEQTFADGAIVLSPTPPRLRQRGAPGPGQRVDLRPSATLSLPNATGSIAFGKWDGITVAQDDAICVGIYWYSALTAGGRPAVKGPFSVGADGWCLGSGMGSSNAAPFGSSFITATPNGVGTAHTSLSVAQATVTVGGTAYPVPIDGVRMGCYWGFGTGAAAQQATLSFADQYTLSIPGSWFAPYPVGATPAYQTPPLVAEARFARLGATVTMFDATAVSGGGTPSPTANYEQIGVRFLYGVPLLT